MAGWNAWISDKKNQERIILGVPRVVSTTAKKVLPKNKHIWTSTAKHGERIFIRISPEIAKRLKKRG